MRFYLTGGGDQENFRSLDKRFLNGLAPGSRVAVLPHATDDYGDALERVEVEFTHRNVSSFELVINAGEELLDYDAIIIEGGNTFDLIDVMRRTSFFSLLKQFAETGKPIYADSAGAIILGADVETAFLGSDGDTDGLKLQDYRGCNLLSGWTLHAHATSDEYEDLNDLLYTKGNPILALPEDCGILIEDGKFEVFGNDSLGLVTFEGIKQVDVGESGQLDL